MAKPKNTVVTEAAAFARGRAEYAAGIPDLPPYATSMLANVWRHGYHYAAVERTKGAGIPLVTTVPQDIDDPVALIAAVCLRSEQRSGDVLDHSTPLPWMMHELIGSRWRNLHTGSHQQVVNVVGTFHQEVEPVWIDGAVGTYYTTIKHGIGRWIDTHYLVQGWVRVDHVPPVHQLAWYGIEIAGYRNSVASTRQSLAGITPIDLCAATNRSMWQQSIAYDQQYLSATIAAAHTFAAAHDLVVPSTVLNAGLAASTTPTQLALF